MLANLSAVDQPMTDAKRRCQQAIKLMQGRRKLNRKEAAIEAGVSYGTLSRFISGARVGIRGRKPRCSETGQNIVANIVQSSAMSLDAKSEAEVLALYQNRILVENGYNTYADLDTFAKLSRRSVGRYMEKAQMTERQGKIKPESRVEPFLNIRNAISKAAGLAATTEVCATENIFSEDEVGIFLFGWHQTSKAPKLVSTQQADAFLRQNNVSLSTSEDSDQQRAAHIGATLQAHTGRLTSYYLRIVDSNFPECFKSSDSTVHKPRIWKLNAKDNFFVVTCHPSVTDTTVCEYISKIISHPAIFDQQDAAVQRDVSHLHLTKPVDTVASDDDNAGITIPSETHADEEQEIREKHKWTTLIRDGAFGQINIGPEMDKWNKDHGRHMFMAKWSAGCSMSEATNDLGYMHSILHKLFTSKDFRCHERSDPPGELYSALKTFRNTHLTPASFRTYWKCICAMELFMNKAFTPMTVQSALKKGGFEGDAMNATTILAHNPEFTRLSVGQSSELLRLIDTVLKPYWWQNGLIHESVFDELFEGDDDIDTLNNCFKKIQSERIRSNYQKAVSKAFRELKEETTDIEEKQARAKIESDKKPQYDQKLANWKSDSLPTFWLAFILLAPLDYDYHPLYPIPRKQ
eukprot:gene13318-9543_t